MKIRTSKFLILEGQLDEKEATGLKLELVDGHLLADDAQILTVAEDDLGVS